jgi:RimJ/RimL family protein N-acetyltransferase
LLAGERRVSGIVELTFRDRAAGMLEAGYWIIESARGGGYATQALVAMTDWVERSAVGKRIELRSTPRTPLR